MSLIEHIAKQGLFVTAHVHHAVVTEREYSKGHRDGPVWAVYIRADEDGPNEACGIFGSEQEAAADAIEVWNRKFPERQIPEGKK